MDITFFVIIILQVFILHFDLRNQVRKLRDQQNAIVSYLCGNRGAISLQGASDKRNNKRKDRAYE